MGDGDIPILQRLRVSLVHPLQERDGVSEIMSCLSEVVYHRPHDGVDLLSILPCIHLLDPGCESLEALDPLPVDDLVLQILEVLGDHGREFPSEEGEVQQVLDVCGCCLMPTLRIHPHMSPPSAEDLRLHVGPVSVDTELSVLPLTVRDHDGVTLDETPLEEDPHAKDLCLLQSPQMDGIPCLLPLHSLVLRDALLHEALLHHEGPIHHILEVRILFDLDPDVPLEVGSAEVEGEDSLQPLHQLPPYQEAHTLSLQMSEEVSTLTLGEEHRLRTIRVACHHLRAPSEEEEMLLP